MRTALFLVQLFGLRTSLASSLGFYQRINGFPYAVFSLRKCDQAQTDTVVFVQPFPGPVFQPNTNLTSV